MKSLLSYELKKIMKRPFTLAVCIGCLAVVVFIVLMMFSQMFTYAWGPDIYGSYEAIPQDELERAKLNYELEDGALVFTGKEAVELEKEYAKWFEGEWDDERLGQIVSEYQSIKDNPDNYTDEIDEWALQMREWTLGGEMTPEQLEAYNEANPAYVMKPEFQYGEWQKWSQVSGLLDEYIIGPDGSARSFEEAFPDVEQPALYEYHNGPLATTQVQGIMIGVLAILMLIAGVAPIFSDEVACKTEPMLLAAKYGRDRLVHAKVLAGLIFAVAALLALTLLNVLLSGAAYGFSGWNVPVQLNTMNYMLPFSMTYGQMLLAMLGYQVLGICAMAAIVMLLSALMRSAIPVVFTSGLLAVAITMIAGQGGSPERYIAQTLPPGALSPAYLLDDGMVDGWYALPLPQWALTIIVCAVFIVIPIIIINRKYKKPSKT